MDGLKKIDNVMFRVSDLQKSAIFYEHVLGLKRAWEDPDARMIGFLFPESDSEIVIHSNSSIPNPDFSFLVDDVVSMCVEFEKDNREIFLQPIDVRCGKFAILSDPDGNKIPIIDLTKFGGKPRYSV